MTGKSADASRVCAGLASLAASTPFPIREVEEMLRLWRVTAKAALQLIEAAAEEEDKDARKYIAKVAHLTREQAGLL